MMQSTTARPKDSDQIHQTLFLARRWGLGMKLPLIGRHLHIIITVNNKSTKVQTLGAELAHAPAMYNKRLLRVTTMYLF